MIGEIEYLRIAQNSFCYMSSLYQKEDVQKWTRNMRMTIPQTVLYEVALRQLFTIA